MKNFQKPAHASATSTSTMRYAARIGGDPLSKSGYNISFKSSPDKGGSISNLGDHCNSSKKRYQKVEPDWFWVYGVELNDGGE